jgi:hypothetical protein
MIILKPKKENIREPSHHNETYYINKKNQVVNLAFQY